MANGILNLYKPVGITSMEAVRRIKRATRDQKVGHGGTLDPIAEGLLPIFFGNASRVMEYLIDAGKTYRAHVLLGVTTDTYDAAGDVTATADASNITRNQVEEALKAFTGSIAQVPPMFSALKHQGQRLYELAREDHEVTREPRQIEITRLAITDWAPPAFGLEIDCGRGTYVRSLIHDIGQALGCGAHMTSLVRSKVGPFTLANSVQLEAFEQAALSGAGEPLLHPADIALTAFPAVHIQRPMAVAITQGKQVRLDLPQLTPHGELIRVYLDKDFIALVRYDKSAGLCQPVKVFAPVQAESIPKSIS
ncbi:MAG: tRNA pseudouridine(55) synthase TruB [Dehalococcoidia bacterium]|nr:tRNA pseudouridine(55) synthase TruB [Dehalococcoidia bacterium]